MYKTENKEMTYEDVAYKFGGSDRTKKKVKEVRSSNGQDNLEQSNRKHKFKGIIGLPYAMRSHALIIFGTNRQFAVFQERQGGIALLNGVGQRRRRRRIHQNQSTDDELMKRG